MILDQVLNGERLVDLRDLLGLSQASLAERLGVNQATISLIERGDRAFPDSVATAAMAEFGLPESFFVVPTVVADAAPVTFRKKAAASVRDEKRVIKKHREASRLFATASLRSDYHPSKLPRPEDYDEDALLLAEVVRSEVGLSAEEPIPNVVRLIERLGVGVISTLEPGDGTDADHVSISRPADADGRPLVALVASCSGDMARLSLAHEIGHMIFDRRLAKPIKSTRSFEEKRAYDFASALLVPDTVMRKCVSETLTLHGYLPIKAQYGVSVAALIVRAQRMGLISDARARSLHIQRSSQGWNKSEPVSVKMENPILLEQSYRQAFPGWSNQSVAFDLGMMPTLIDEWVENRPAESNKAAGVVSLDDWRRRKAAS